MRIWSFPKQRWMAASTCWTEPLETGPDNPGALVIRFMVNGVHMGIIVFHDGGPYYPMTQLTRFGCIGGLDHAKLLVETHAVIDVMEYPVAGMA